MQVEKVPCHHPLKISNNFLKWLDFSKIQRLDWCQNDPNGRDVCQPRSTAIIDRLWRENQVWNRRKKKNPSKNKSVYIFFFNFGDLGFVCCFVEWVGIPCWIRQHRRQVEPSPHTWAPLMNFGCPLRSHLRYFLISLFFFFFFLFPSPTKITNHPFLFIFLILLSVLPN